MTTLAQRSFAGGEIAPSLYARTDLLKYQTGARLVRNFVVQKHGGVANRAGTQFIAEVKDSTKTVRLIKFVFNDEQTYVMEFGEGYIRFFQDGGAVTVSAVAAWADMTSYAIGDLVENDGDNYYCYVAHSSGASTEPGVGVDWEDKWHALTGDIYEIPSPFTEEQLPYIKLVQSADVVILAHPDHDPLALSRLGHTEWTLTIMSFAPTIAAPANVVATPSVGTATFKYVVTAIKEETYEESVASSVATASSALAPTATDPIVVTWDAVAGAVEYYVYKQRNGVYGFIGVAAEGETFDDTGYTADTSETPPTVRDPFADTDDKPSTVAFFQQRLSFANTNNDSEKIYTSRTGSYFNFSQRLPLQDDDPITFNLAGRTVQAVKHLIELGRPIVLTANGEWVLNGDQAGILTPAEINPRQHGYAGSSDLPPIVIEGSILFVQARGSVIRDLSYEQSVEGYRGNDLTVFATHLFEGHQIVDWDFQQIPNSVAWVVRDDGNMVGLTYLKAHELWGWHRHDTTAGLFENVCCVPEGDEDRMYVVVQRLIDGNLVRYIERMATRHANHDVFDIETEAFFADSFLIYDGYNTTATTMTLSGGTTWDHTEPLTLTASASFFAAEEVGNSIILYDESEGDFITLDIVEYTSVTVVTVHASKTVPAYFRNVATLGWARAVDVIANLEHLEGETVNILADGNVEPQQTVTGGQVTLSRTAAFIVAGLPIQSDLELLDIDSFEGEVFKNKKHLITEVTLQVQASRGIFAGPNEDRLKEFKQRSSEAMNSPILPYTGPLTIPLEAGWNSNGRVFIRQDDPLPLCILSVFPTGYVTRQ